MMTLAKWAEIRLSPDCMKAELVLNRVPEEPLSSQSLRSFLDVHGVRYGVKEEILERIALRPDLFLYQPVLIAEGTPPQNGADSQVKYVFECSDETPSLQEKDGRVDYRELNRINNVKKGQLLALRTMPTEGIPGMTVTGERIAAKPGKKVPIKIGKNVYLDPSGDHAFAAIDGLVSVKEGKLEVLPVYEVNGDVDYSVGNISFLGTVIIRGSVLAGFRIHADGDIRVFGDVEAAEVSASGNVEVRGGIVGLGKGTVRAGGNVICNYINQANVYAQDSIFVYQSILHSQVQAGRTVKCVDGRGVIVGGKVLAGERIEAKQIGNAGNTPTELEVGVPHSIRQEYHLIQQEIRELGGELEKAKKGLGYLENMTARMGKLPPDKAELRLKLMQHRVMLEGKLKILEERKSEMEKKLETFSQAQIVVLNVIYPGSKLIFGKYIHPIRSEHTRVVFQLKEGEISVKSL